MGQSIWIYFEAGFQRADSFLPLILVGVKELLTPLNVQREYSALQSLRKHPSHSNAITLNPRPGVIWTQMQEGDVCRRPIGRLAFNSPPLRCSCSPVGACLYGNGARLPENGTSSSDRRQHVVEGQRVLSCSGERESEREGERRL